MLTVKGLMATLEGLDPDAQVVVGIVDGPSYNAAYAEQHACARAEVDRDQRLTLLEAAAPALYLCCYEQPRPWEDGGWRNVVAPEDACPRCGERNADRLVWQQRPHEGVVRCVSCGALYEPKGAGGPSGD